MSGPRLLRTQGPRLLDTQGPRLLKTDGPRLLRTAEGPRLLRTQTRSLHTDGPRLLKTEGPRLLRTQGPRLLETEGPRLLKTQGPRLLKTQTRNLHTTGSASSSSILTSDKPVSGSLGPRLPVSEGTVPWTHETGNALRHFNTSRSLKAVNDTSTIDFAYIPEFDPDARAPEKIRVPIILSTATSAATQASIADADAPVMIPTIYTVAADGTHIHAPSAMSDVTEGDHIDFQGIAAQVASKLQKPVEEAEGMAKQLWTGLVDDVFGPKHGGASKA